VASLRRDLADRVLGLPVAAALGAAATVDDTAKFVPPGG
jgi:hypothetical protein